MLVQKIPISTYHETKLSVNICQKLRSQRKEMQNMLTNLRGQVQCIPPVQIFGVTCPMLRSAPMLRVTCEAYSHAAHIGAGTGLSGRISRVGWNVVISLFVTTLEHLILSDASLTIYWESESPAVDDCRLRNCCAAFNPITPALSCSTLDSDISFQYFTGRYCLMASNGDNIAFCMPVVRRRYI